MYSALEGSIPFGLSSHNIVLATATQPLNIGKRDSSDIISDISSASKSQRRITKGLPPYGMVPNVHDSLAHELANLFD